MVGAAPAVGGDVERTDTADCTATVGIGQGEDVVGVLEGAETAADDDGRCWFGIAGDAPGVVVAVECDTLVSGEDIKTAPTGVVPVDSVVGDDVDALKEEVTGTPETSVWFSSRRLLVPRVVLSFRLSAVACRRI